MNRIHRMLAGFALLAASQVGAESCPGYADARLISLMQNVVLVAEQIDAVTHQRSAQLSAEVGTLREIVGGGDPEALRTACNLLSQFPSLEAALADSARLLGEAELQAWLAQASNPPQRGSSFNCLTDSQYQATRSVLTVLRTTNMVLQGACDAVSCFPLICRTCNVIALVVGLVIPPFEAGLAVDDLFCSTQHSNDMADYCDSPNGACSAGRGGVTTLVEIEQQVSGSVLPAVSNLDAGAATGDTLDDTRELLETRVERTQSQIVTLSMGLSEDAARRRDFQRDLETLDLEVALSVPVATVPIDLQLPSAFGGRLETVREVVADAIVNSQRAGIKVDSALVLLRQGDDWFNAGNYADAFDAYRSAYQELVQ